MAAISAAELDATWRQLERVPRPDLARALARAQELGAAAFKRKDYQGAYDHYNQAVTGLEYLARTGALIQIEKAGAALASFAFRWFRAERLLEPCPPRGPSTRAPQLRTRTRMTTRRSSRPTTSSHVRPPG